MKPFSPITEAPHAPRYARKLSSADLQRIKERHDRDTTNARKFSKVASRPEQDRDALLRHIAYLEGK